MLRPVSHAKLCAFLLCLNCAVAYTQENYYYEGTNDGTTTGRPDLEDSIGFGKPNETGAIFPVDLNVVGSAIETLRDNQCRRDSRKVVGAIRDREPWAMQMFDASTKLPVGVLYGSTYQLGNFDECVSVGRPINGQYCLANIRAVNNENIQVSRATFNDTLHWAVCVPSSCTSDDVTDFLGQIFKTVHPDEVINVVVQNSDCYYNQTVTFSTWELIYGSAMIIYLLFTGAATLYHIIWLYRKEHRQIYTVDEKTKFRHEYVHRFVLSFSLTHNVKKLLETKGHKHDLNCMSGLKFLCMLLIIPGHSLLFIASGPVMNSEFYTEAITKVQNGLFLNNPLLVDTFLFLSGFLMCRLLMAEFDRSYGKLNLFLLYLRRYIRLTPSYLVVIGLYCTFLARLDSGPLWNSVIVTEQERCIKSWWSNLLYVNNYVNSDYLCMFQSWYLAADTQLFFVAPFIIYPLWRYKTLGKLLLGIVTITSIVIPGIQTYSNKLDPTLMIYPSEVFDLNSNTYFKNVYIKTHIRASSYCIGLIFGYVIYKIQSSSAKIPWYVNCCGWTLSVLCSVSSMFSVTVFYQPGHEYDLIEATLYATLHRVGWCLAFGWIVMACTTANGGLVNKFLSWSFFMPLSRLTYCAYLVNGLIELHALGTLRQPRHMSIYDLASLVTSHLVLTFVAAFILCVLFESPIHNLEKIVIERRQTHHRSSNSNKTKIEL